MFLVVCNLQILITLPAQPQVSFMSRKISTRLGHKNHRPRPNMSYNQPGVKGHVGVTGVKKVIFSKNATPPTESIEYMLWSCD